MMRFMSVIMVLLIISLTLTACQKEVVAPVARDNVPGPQVNDASDGKVTISIQRPEQPQDEVAGIEADSADSDLEYIESGLDDLEW